MGKRSRRTYLDVIRVLAACAVVLLHTVSGVPDAQTLHPAEQRVFSTVMELTKWSVPVFLMVSGYLFLGYDRGQLTLGIMLKKYCLRIAVALLIFGGSFAFLEKLAGGGDFSLRLIGESVLAVFRGESWAHMWYLYLILVLYMLTPLLRKAVTVLPYPVVCSLLGVVFLCSSIIPFADTIRRVQPALPLPDWGIYVFYYGYGYLFSREDMLEERRDVSKPWRACFQAVIAPVVVIVLAAGVVVCRLKGIGFRMAYNDPFTALLALSIFTWARSWSRLREGESGKRRVEWMDRGLEGFLREASALTFGIYLMHPVFLNFCYKFLKVTPLSFDIRWSLPLFFLGALLSSAAATWILRKIPLMRNYVL